MKRISLAAAMFSLLLCAVTVQAQNLLLNGELTTPAGNNEAADNWNKLEPSLDGGGAAVDSFRFQKASFADRNGAGGVDGDTNTADTGGMWFRAFTGVTQTNPNTVDASAWQDVATGAGLYSLTFWEKHERGFNAQSAAVSLEYFQGTSSLGSVSFDLLATPSLVTDPETWVQRTLPGTAPAGTDSIRVMAAMVGGMNNVVPPGTSNPQSMMLDGFVLTVVPEPTSLALVGLSLVGLLGMRRR